MNKLIEQIKTDSKTQDGTLYLIGSLMTIISLIYTILSVHKNLIKKKKVEKEEIFSNFLFLFGLLLQLPYLKNQILAFIIIIIIIFGVFIATILNLINILN